MSWCCSYQIWKKKLAKWLMKRLWKKKHFLSNEIFLQYKRKSEEINWQYQYLWTGGELSGIAYLSQSTGNLENIDVQPVSFSQSAIHGMYIGERHKFFPSSLPCSNTWRFTGLRHLIAENFLLFNFFHASELTWRLYDFYSFTISLFMVH